MSQLKRRKKKSLLFKNLRELKLQKSKLKGKYLQRKLKIQNKKQRKRQKLKVRLNKYRKRNIMMKKMTTRSIRVSLIKILENIMLIRMDSSLWMTKSQTTLKSSNSITPTIRGTEEVQDRGELVIEDSGEEWAEEEGTDEEAEEEAGNLNLRTRRGKESMVASIREGEKSESQKIIYFDLKIRFDDFLQLFQNHIYI